MIDPYRDMVIVFLTNKRNTKITDSNIDINQFDGNWYTTASLGFVPQILSIGLDSSTDFTMQIHSLLEDMVYNSRLSIPKDVDLSSDHPSVLNYESKKAVLLRYSSSSL